MDFTSGRSLFATGSGGLKVGKTARWTKVEDGMLRAAVNTHEGKNWKAIADMVPDRDDRQCLHRWTYTLKPGIRKGRWSQEEDDVLKQVVAGHTEVSLHASTEFC